MKKLVSIMFVICNVLVVMIFNTPSSVYAQDLVTDNSKSIHMNKSKNYTGISLLHQIDTSLDVTTASGAGFTVNAK